MLYISVFLILSRINIKGAEPVVFDELMLIADKIRKYKQEWEQTVLECKSDNPTILAVLNVYGDYDNIHSVRLLIQNVNSKIIYQRIYHLLTGTPDQWTDAIVDEVLLYAIQD